MNITVEILGRPAMDQPFAQVVAPTGVSPAPAPVVSKTFGAFGGQVRDVPFSEGQSFHFRRSGAVA